MKDEQIVRAYAESLNHRFEDIKGLEYAPSATYQDLSNQLGIIVSDLIEKRPH